MSTPQPGEASLDIHGYERLTPIGRGASSTVYKGFDPVLSRWVAIKVLLTDDPDDPARRRFKREGEITATLGKHPHIVQVLGTGFTTSDQPYVVMEYFEEGSIGDRLRSSGTFSVRDTLGIGEKIADAVSAAHRAGILHRDIKPQNVLLSEYGPALADFGIARAATNLEWSLSLEQLTPLHSPPETLSGDPSTDRSDIYSLGSTLYTMLAGRAPFAGPANESLLRYEVRVFQDPVPPIPRVDIPDGLTAALLTALAKDPAERFASAADFRDALRRLGADVSLYEEPELLLDLAMEAPAPRLSTSATAQPVAPPEAPSVDPDTLTRNPAGPAGSTEESLADDDTLLRGPTSGASQSSAEQDAETILRNGRAAAADPKTEPAPRRSRRIVFAVGLVVVLIGGILGIIDLIGHSAPSSKVTSGSSTVTLKNDRPTITGISAAGSSATMTWQDPKAAGDQFIVGMQGGGEKHLSPTNAGATSWKFSGLTSGTHYCFGVEPFEGSEGGHLVVGEEATECLTQD